MRIYPISTYNNNKITLNQNFTGAINYSEIKPMLSSLREHIGNNISSSVEDIEMIPNLMDRLGRKLEKYSDSTILNFKKISSSEYSVFIENPFSYYKQLLPNIKLSEQENISENLNVLKKMVKDVESTNQFDVELKFVQMRNNSVPRDEFKPVL